MALRQIVVEPVLGPYGNPIQLGRKALILFFCGLRFQLSRKLSVLIGETNVRRLTRLGLCFLITSKLYRPHPFRGAKRNAA